MQVIKYAEVPDMNPIRFIRENHRYEAYQTLTSDWYVKQLNSWDIKADYKQPWNLFDYIGVQIFVGGLYKVQAQYTRLQIVDGCGNILAEVAPSYTGDMVGNVRNYNGANLQMATVNFQTGFNNFTATEGTYYLRIKLVWDNGGNPAYDYYISEPLSVKVSHSDTRILEYLSNTNKLKVDYSSGMFFHLRVEGAMEYVQPKIITTQYNDQDMNPRMQHATPSREVLLKMGQNKGCPMWVYDKVNRAFSNDYILADKVRYVRNPGEIEIGNRIPCYQRTTASISLAEYDTDASSQYVDTVPLVVFSFQDMPAVLYSGKLINTGTGNEVNFWNGYEMTNSTDVVNMIAAFNAHAPVVGLTGTFSYSGFDVIYTNGVGEAFDSADCLLLKGMFGLDYLKNGPAIQPNLFLVTSRCAVVFGAASEVFIQGDGSTTNYQFVHPTYTYPASVTEARVRIYHDDHITQLMVNEAGKSSTIRNFYIPPITLPGANTIPTSLERLQVIGGIFDQGMNFAAFPATMHGIIMRYQSALFQSVTGFNKNWVELITADFSNNFLTSAMVDSIFNQHFNGNAYLPPNGLIFRTIGQNPAAPPTGASLTARGKIIINGGTIITD